MTKRFCTHCKVLLLGFLKMLQSRIVLTAFPQRFTLKFIKKYNSGKTAGFLACLEDKCYLINNVILFLSVFRALREKCPNTEFFLVRIFLYSDWITGKYGPERNSIFGLLSRSERHIKYTIQSMHFFRILRYCHANWKNTDTLLLACFKNILKVPHSNYL